MAHGTRFTHTSPTESPVTDLARQEREALRNLKLWAEYILNTRRVEDEVAVSGTRHIKMAEAALAAREDTERPADDVLAAAAIMVGALLDVLPAPTPEDGREWLDDLVATQGAAFPGAEKLQRASEKILREMDDPMSQLNVRDTEREPKG